MQYGRFQQLDVELVESCGVRKQKQDVWQSTRMKDRINEYGVCSNRVANRVMDGWNDKMRGKMETECGCRCLILGCSVQVDSNFFESLHCLSSKIIGVLPRVLVTATFL